MLTGVTFDAPSQRKKAYESTETFDVALSKQGAAVSLSAVPPAYGRILTALE